MNNINNDILKKLLNNDKEKVKDFVDVLSLATSLNRECEIADIEPQVGEAVETFIRFWNKVDNENNIPVEEREPIKIYINSAGGDLHATLTMINAVRMSKTPVYTINIGNAYSGGFFLFIAGHKRFAYEDSTFLYHEGSTGAGKMDAGKFRNYSNFYDRLLERLKEITLKYTSITEEEYNAHKKDDWWIFSDEALKLNICDEILTEFIN